MILWFLFVVRATTVFTDPWARWERTASGAPEETEDPWDFQDLKERR